MDQKKLCFRTFLLSLMLKKNAFVCCSVQQQPNFGLPVSAESVTLKLSNTNRTTLENNLQFERLCINYIINYFNLHEHRKINILDLLKVIKTIFIDLPKDSKLTCIFNLLKVSKMTSMRIFVSPVMEELRTSNLRSRYTSLKGFHRAFHHRMKWLHRLISVMEELQLLSLDRKCMVFRSPQGTSPEMLVTLLPYSHVNQLWRV